MALKGVDVSLFQGKPDWKKVKASGVDFAIIKATQGRSESGSAYLFKDRSFAYNITTAPKNGIYCGVYHYFTAKTEPEAQTEAKFFVDTIKPYKKNITLYAAVDVESKHLSGLSKSELTNLVIHFCDYVRKSGFTPIVYTNPDWLRNRLNGIGNELLWLALWRDKNNTPTGYGNMKIWQWGGSAVGGISGNVDSNFGYFDLPKAQKPNVPTIVCFPKANYNGVSLVDGLRSVGVNTSFSYRMKIAKANGVNNYIGTAKQNIALLNKLKQGKLVKP